MNLLLTDEEKAAKKIIDALSDLRLDLDYLGSYLSQLSSNEIADRIRRVTEPFHETQRKVKKSRSLAAEFFIKDQNMCNSCAYPFCMN